jgi:microcystin-dependent protein
MKKLILLSAILFSFSGIFAQSVGINEDNSQPDASAILDVKSTSKGMLIPRLTTYQRENMANTSLGLLVFDTDTESFWYYTTAWTELISNAKESDPVFKSSVANSLTDAGSGKVITDDERTSLNSALQSESDPIYSASVASKISAEDTVRWNGIIGIPVGTIIPYAGTSVPEGWKACDGTTLSRTDYALLFAAIGTAWGTGDAATTFNLPDLRGRFPRGYDNGAGNDPDAASRVALSGGNTGDKVGSYQEDEFESHTHSLNAWGFEGSGSNNTPTDGSKAGAQMGANGGNETRHKNAYVNYIIKY